MTTQPNDIIDYWYADKMKTAWFQATPQIDARIHEKYHALWEEAKAGKLEHWLTTANGCLALAIVLDQFPLNMFRNTAKSFATESQAIGVTKHAIEKNLIAQLPQKHKSFLIMPLMHSEHLADQDLSVSQFKAHQLADNARFAEHHRELIKKYGRFPHRNAALGRTNSQAEQDYLTSEHAFLG